MVHAHQGLAKYPTLWTEQNFCYVCRAAAAGRLREFLADWKDRIAKEDARTDAVCITDADAWPQAAQQQQALRAGHATKAATPAAAATDSDSEASWFVNSPAARRGRGKPRVLGDDSGDDVAHEAEVEVLSLSLAGPPGCGKTAAVYALAQELGFKVLEVNPTMDRAGAQVCKERMLAAHCTCSHDGSNLVRV